MDDGSGTMLLGSRASVDKTGCEGSFEKYNAKEGRSGVVDMPGFILFSFLIRCEWRRFHIWPAQATRLLAVFLGVSPGLFVSSTSFLPSSFAQALMSFAVALTLQKRSSDWSEYFRTLSAFGAAMVIVECVCHL